MTKDEQTQLMREQRDQGWTLEQIAAEHGVSVSTAHRRLNPRERNDTAPRPADPGVHTSNLGDTAAMWRQWVGGTPQHEIAQQYGINQSSVSERLRRFQRSIPQTDRETILQREIDRLDDIFTPLLRLATNEPPQGFSNGRPMFDADGKPVPDWQVVISAAGTVLKIQDRLAKFLGLDAPAKAEVLHVEAATEAAKAEAEAALAYLAGEGSATATSG